MLDDGKPLGDMRPPRAVTYIGTMIKFTTTHVELSVDIAVALLAFASNDKTRGNLGVGVNDGEMCATDGHTAVRFHVPAEDRSAVFERAVWTYSYVSQEIRVARARKKSVFLALEDCFGKTFPDLRMIEKQNTVAAADLSKPVGMNGLYLSRLAAVCRACRRDATKLSIPPAILESFGELYPIRFSVGKRGLQGEYPHSASVLIMPVRY